MKNSESGFLRGRTALLACIMGLLVLSCGKKAPPVPWETVVPKRIVDLEAVPRDGQVRLAWTVPKENTDKTVLTDLAEFKVSKAEGSLVGGECRGCVGKPQVFYEMKLGSQGDLRGKRISISIDDLEPQKAYVFTVSSVNRRGHVGSASNPVEIFWDFPPQRPAAAGGERGDKRVDLSWEAVQGAAGYNVYRKAEGEDFSGQPLNRGLLTATSYTDLNVENEKKYLYSVRAVKRVGKTDVEGKGSMDVPITPTDLVPPAPPSGLVAIPLKDGIELNWKRSQEPDLLGYHVYRRTSGEAQLQRLSETPVTKETYLDRDVKLGQDYEYAVAAVDNSPRRNASNLSEEVRVRYLYQ